MSIGVLHLDPQEFDLTSIQTGALVGLGTFFVFLLILLLLSRRPLAKKVLAVFPRVSPTKAK